MPVSPPAAALTSSLPATWPGCPWVARMCLTVRLAACSTIFSGGRPGSMTTRSEEHTSELQSPCNLVCRLLLEKKNTQDRSIHVRTERESRLHIKPRRINAGGEWHCRHNTAVVGVTRHQRLVAGPDDDPTVLVI